MKLLALCVLAAAAAMFLVSVGQGLYNHSLNRRIAALETRSTRGDTNTLVFTDARFWGPPTNAAVTKADDTLQRAADLERKMENLVNNTELLSLALAWRRGYEVGANVAVGATLDYCLQRDRYGNFDARTNLLSSIEAGLTNNPYPAMQKQ